MGQPPRRRADTVIEQHMGIAVTYYRNGQMRVWATKRDAATGRYHSELLMSLEDMPFHSERSACAALLGALEVITGRLRREAEEDVDQLSLFG